jgi:hypothetical protein
MKRIILITLILIAGTAATMFAQDIIVPKKGDKIKAYDVKIVGAYITYKKADDNSRTARIAQSLVKKIEYENGEEEIIDPDYSDEDDEFDEEEEVVAQPRRNTSTTAQRNTSTTRSASTSAQRNTQPARRPAASTVRGTQTPRRQTSRGYSDYDDDAADYDEVEEQPFRRNSIGLNIGASALFGEITGLESSGLHFAIQYGLLFNRSIGMNIQFFGNNYSSSSSYASWGVQYDGLLVGPLMALPLSRSRKVELFLKPAIGLGWANALDDGSIKGDSFGFGFAAGMSSSFRFNLGTRFALTADLDLYYGNVDDSNEYVKVDDSKFNSAAFSVGAYYRF